MVNRKNFNAIVFTADESLGNHGYITYHKQTNLMRLIRYCNEKYKDWRFMTIYDRKTNEKELIKRDGLQL